MKIITFFAPGSGCGRTTAVLAITSAMLDAGMRVLVLEITDSSERPTRLQDWADRMAQAGFGPDRIMVSTVVDHDSLVRQLALADENGVDFVLVDTPGSTTEVVQDALDSSTLVVFPVTGVMQAYFSHVAIIRNLRYPAHVYGLVSDVEDWDEEQVFRGGFLDMPVLETALPHRKLFQHQIKKHDLFQGAHEWEADSQACAAARDLGEELRKLADDVAQRPPPPKSRDMRDPAVQAEVLAGLFAKLARNAAASE